MPYNAPIQPDSWAAHHMFYSEQNPAAWPPVFADLDQPNLQASTWRVSTVTTACPRMGSLAGPDKCPALDRALGTLPPREAWKQAERGRIYTAEG